MYNAGPLRDDCIHTCLLHALNRMRHRAPHANIQEVANAILTTAVLTHPLSVTIRDDKILQNIFDQECRRLYGDLSPARQRGRLTNILNNHMGIGAGQGGHPSSSSARLDSIPEEPEERPAPPGPRCEQPCQLCLRFTETNPTDWWNCHGYGICYFPRGHDDRLIHTCARWCVFARASSRASGACV